MAKLADRIAETSVSTGTEQFTLGGALSGRRAFNDAFLNGDSVYYCIQHESIWEIGIGTFTAPNTLYRTTVLSNSSGNTNKVSFGSGTKTVFNTAPAHAWQNLALSITRETHLSTGGNFVTLDSAYIPGTNTLSVYINGVKQELGESYVESTPTRITFMNNVTAGARILIEIIGTA